MILRDHAGFGLIEILFVVVLAGILFAIGIPSLQESQNYYRLTSSASQIAAELNAARILAISRGAIYTVSFDSVTNSMQIAERSDPDNPTRTQKTLETGVTFRTLPLAPITFFSRGHARGGTIELQNQNGTVISIEIEASGLIQVKEMGV